MRRPEARTARVADPIAALLLGAVSVVGFAPFGWFPVIWLTLGGFCLLLDRTAPDDGKTTNAARRGALLGAAFGFGLFISGVSWVFVSLSTFGGMPAPIAGLATVLFCAFLALYPALAGGFFVRFLPPRWWQRSLLIAALWTVGEWLRGWIFTGFPWLAVGYSQTPPSPLAGFAPITGVFGVSFLTVFVAAAGAETVLRWRNGPTRQLSRWSGLRRSSPLVAVLLVLAGGQALNGLGWTSAQGEAFSVALLQGNVAQDIKWRPEKFEESLRTYYRLALENPAQLTVLPETALPAFLNQIPAEYLDELKKLAERQHGDMLLGIAMGDMQGYANGAISLGRSPSQRYSKSHLVPFGEFVPPGFAWFLSLANIPMSDFTPGPDKQAPMNIAGQKIAVNICYEDAFGEEIIRALPEATVLINLSNVAWFGDSLAPAQHLQIARMRALETGRMMLRATNTGMTAIVSADGRVVSALKPFTRAALVGEVRAYEGSTPFVRTGNWPVIACSIVLIAILRRRKALS
jgi:apolipoprotein N-acyltransferase